MVAKNNPKLTAILKRHVSTPDVITLRWDDSGILPGLWVRCSARISLAKIAEMGRGLYQGNEEDEDALANSAAIFGDLLLAWNEADPELDAEGEYVYDDAGNPKAVDVPATAAGFASRSPIVQVTIMRTYFERLGGLSVPVLGKSSNGKQSEAPLATTEPLLVSPQS